MLVVKLDNAAYGAGAATVIDKVESVDEYFKRFRDRDGAMDDRLRLWNGEAVIGDRVETKQYNAGGS